MIGWMFVEVTSETLKQLLPGIALLTGLSLGSFIGFILGIEFLNKKE